MEGVGARLGRSSTRYGPATVFSGPVRKWKKRWVHVSPSNSSTSNLSHQNHHIHSNSSSINASSNGNNGSHLLLYKWTPLTPQSSNNKDNSNINGDSKHSQEDDDAAQLQEEPPRRKFKYFPVYLLEKEKYEAGEESKLSDAEPTTVEQIPKGDGFDEKPDINDTPMEETQDDNQVVRQDLNERTLDLSLGLNSHDDDSDAKPDQLRDGRLERVNSSSVGT